MTIYSYYRSFSHWGQFKILIITNDKLFFDGENYYQDEEDD